MKLMYCKLTLWSYAHTVWVMLTMKTTDPLLARFMLLTYPFVLSCYAIYTCDYSKIFAFVAVYNNTGHGLFDMKVVQFKYSA
jgi:hypothetical protein